MKPFISIILLLFALYAHSQVIPAERQVNWSDALLSYQFAAPYREINVMDYGATGNGNTNDQPAIMSAIAALGGNLGYVYFPPGNYLITAPLILPDSVILKGYSSDSTVLSFNFGTVSLDCITLSGGVVTGFIQIDGGYIKGNYRVISDSAFMFNSLDYAEIVENNGSWDIVPINWAAESVGQIVQIDHVSDDTVFLFSPLRITYESQLNPRIRKISPRVNAGVECLKIKRLDQSVAGANIMMSLAANCVVRGVESATSVAAHVNIFQSTRILVDGNYFHHAFLYDGASQHGYGVTLNSHSGECLITNNIFRYLRHAMMVKTGANGNVFSYNYSREVHRSEPFSNYGGDISLHGHYAYANLFEGNIVQNIQIDHEWGPSGPYNTFFRNRAENYGIIFSNGNPLTSNSEHIVGNDVSNIIGFYTITGSNHIEHGNNVYGTIKPPGTNTLADTSYYLTEEPEFWDITDSWPSLGIPNILGAGNIPARSRWFGPEVTKTVCPLKKEWTGSVSSNWNDPHNWHPFGVPDDAMEVDIPASAPNSPQISSGMVYYVRSLLVEQNAGIQLSNGSWLIVVK